MTQKHTKPKGKKMANIARPSQAKTKSTTKSPSRSTRKKQSSFTAWLSKHRQPVIVISFAVVFATIGVALLSHSSAAVPGASGVTYNVWTWNIAGEKINKGKTTTGVTRTAANSIVSRDVQLASFNEICKDQYNDVVKRLKNAKWSNASRFSYFAMAVKTKSSCRGHGGGNAIFVKAGLSNVTVTKLADDIAKERRNLVCAMIGKTSDTFCTTHITIQTNLVKLTATDTPQPANVVQLAQVNAKLEQYYNSGRRVIIAGDFNSQPSYGRLNGWYAPSVSTPANGNNSGAYREIDDLDARCPGYGERTENTNDKATPCPSGSKIDLIFFRENLVSSYSADALTISNNCSGRACSDHDILTGHVTFK